MEQKTWLKQLQAQLYRQRILLQRDIARLWAHKDYKRLGFLSLHYIGFVGYVLVTFYACFTFGLALWLGGIIHRDVLTSGPFRKGREGELPNVFFWVMRAFLWFLMLLYRIFSGFMGWGFIGSRPEDVLFVMLHAIPDRLPPNKLTACFGIPTLLGAGWLLIDYVIIPAFSSLPS